jgi:hypothetical protein
VVVAQVLLEAPQEHLALVVTERHRLFQEVALPMQEEEEVVFFKVAQEGLVELAVVGLEEMMQM